MFRKLAIGIPVAAASVLAMVFSVAFKVTLSIALAATAYFIPGTSIASNAVRQAPSVQSAQHQVDGYTSQTITSTAISQYPAVIPLASLALGPGMDKSVDGGVAELNEFLRNNEGHTVVMDYSQGAVVSTVWLQKHANGKDPSAPAAEDLSFIHIGNPSRPNGGVLARFPGLYIPFFGIKGYGATPQSQYQTVDVAKQYDFFADFPVDPLNPFALVNAVFGLAQHANYGDVDLDDPRNDVQVVGNTTYITVYAKHLPMLQPLYSLAELAGRKHTPLLDAIEGPLRILVESGYDRSNMGAPTSVQPFSSLPRLAGMVQQQLNALNPARKAPKSPQPSVAPDVSASSAEPEEVQSSPSGDVQDAPSPQAVNRSVGTNAVQEPVRTDNEVITQSEDPQGSNDDDEVSETDNSQGADKPSDNSENKPRATRPKLPKPGDVVKSVIRQAHQLGHANLGNSKKKSSVGVNSSNASESKSSSGDNDKKDNDSSDK